MGKFASYGRVPPKLVAGERCLDFLNTVEWRGRPEAREERLTSYGEFAIWAKAAGLIDGRQQRQLMALAAKAPRAAAKALAEIQQAREALAVLLAGPATRRAPSIAAINRILARDRFVLRLESDKAGYRECWELECPQLRQPLLALLREVATLLASPDLARIHHCANDHCQWFFLDTSRNQSRRWCRMEICGNNAKARVYYHRHRSGT